ncbi:MAG: hypothetical protein L6R38_006447 [Xanthoria sp. 2 TBL-2021]|nr:MAG: hypothetical protein L6R38_006447 [Xanthoria sp. 2 TBL-2021]
MHRLLMLILCALALVFLPSAASAQSQSQPESQRLPKRVLTRSQQVSRRNFPGPSFRQQGRRAEPFIADDIVDSANRPSPRDRVNGAIYDALQLVIVALDKIDNDNTIFPNYFSRRDREKVKAVFQAIAGPCNTGNVMLSDLTLTTQEAEKEPCTKDTLAYLYPPKEEKASITLCPTFFKKKAFTMVKGAPDPDNNPTHYVRCEELQANGHVSYLMETMGATLLHEYTHFDKLTYPIYSKSIVDTILRGEEVAYGAWAVYNQLNKKLLARINADSYTYYALEVFWTEVCNTNFLAPRENIDDADPDCGESVCTRDRSSTLAASSGDDSSLSSPPPSDDLGSVPP